MLSFQLIVKMDRPIVCQKIHLVESIAHIAMPI